MTTFASLSAGTVHTTKHIERWARVATAGQSSHAKTGQRREVTILMAATRLRRATGRSWDVPRAVKEDPLRYPGLEDRPPESVAVAGGDAGGRVRHEVGSQAERAGAAGGQRGAGRVFGGVKPTGGRRSLVRWDPHT